MTDVPAPGAPSPFPVPAPAPRRPVWPWVLGGAGLLFLLLLIAAGIAVVVFVNAGSAAKKVVLDFDRAYETQDCDLLEASTTPGFLEDNFGYPFDCAVFQETAAALTVDGVYEYSVVILAARESGGTAEVTTIETDRSTGEPAVFNLTYYLVRSGDHWLIDGTDDGS